MPSPTTRRDLIELLETTFQRLCGELDKAGPDVADLPCVDDWSVRDLLAVRAWWTEQVVEWIEAGRRGEMPVTPAPGYRWNETPRLNADIVEAARHESYAEIRNRLERGFERVLATVHALDDRQLLDAGIFVWAGKWPIARWISINTQRQYATARSYIRRALRSRHDMQ